MADSDERTDEQGAASRADAVRSAVDQAFQAAGGQAQVTRDRAGELVDELAQAAGRVREVLDDLRPPAAEDVRALREELRALEQRVAALERRTGPSTSQGG